MLSSRSLSILNKIVEEEGSIDIKSLASTIDISERSIRYDLEKIGDYLEENSLGPLKKEFGGRIILEGWKGVEAYLKEIYINRFLGPQERVDYLLIRSVFERVISLKKISEELDVSRTTIKGDLKTVKELLKEEKVGLRTLPKVGLELTGSEEGIRRVQLRLLIKHFKELTDYMEKRGPVKESFLLNTLKGYFSEIEIGHIKTFINYTQKLMGKIISDEAYAIITAYVMVMLYGVREGRTISQIKNENFLKATSEYQSLLKGIGILEANFDLDIQEGEILKITDYFLGSHTYNFDHSYYKNWVEVEVMVKNLIERFNSRVDVDISMDETLLDGLINHIKPTIYRIKNNIQLQNSICDEVTESYPILFDITREVIAELEGFIDCKFTDDEVAFLTLHFKAAMDRNRYRLQNIKNVLLVCGLGYGSSKLLAQQIRDIYSVNVVDIIPRHQLERSLKEKEVDLVITTLDITGISKAVVKVGAILSPQDIHTLDKYALPKSRKKVLLSDLMEVVSARTDIIDREGLIRDFKTLFEDRIIDDYERRKLGIIDLLPLSNIRLNQKADSWREAIHLSGEILVEGGATNTSYIKSMIDVVEEYGSYIVISEGLAIPHARSSGNISRTSMSLVTLKEAVTFPNGKEVDTLFAFSSLDDKEHLDSLVDLMNLINDHNLRGQLRKMKNREEVLKFIYKYKLK